MKFVKSTEAHNIAVALADDVMGKDLPKEQRKRAVYKLRCGVKDYHLINYVYYRCSGYGYADCLSVDKECKRCGAKFIGTKDRIY